jgi:hypothetical protein
MFFKFKRISLQFKMKIYVFTLLFLLITLPLSATTLKGRVIDAKTSKPLSFVNIGVKGTRYGTASNSAGTFVLNIPEQHKRGVLRFSCIGYEAKELAVSGFMQEKIVRLKPSVTPLTEVTVMPDSTLRSFLRKAFRKIPENYTGTSSLLKGFYRATLSDSTNSDNLRFMEALIESYKTSYGDKQDGTVKVSKTRKYISGDHFFPTFFYGGVHSTHNSDFVKKRSEILQGHKNYDYQLTGLKAYDNGKVYEIAFSPAEGAKSILEGKIYVELENLAFVQINIQDTESRLKKRNTEIRAPNIKSVQIDEIVVYGLHQGRYYLKSIRGFEIFKGQYEGRFVSTYEYITTNIHTENVSNIVFKDQVSITYTPALEAEDYMESDWKDYNILALPDVVNLVDTLSGNRILSSEAKFRESFSKKVLTTLLKLEFGYNVGWMDVSVPGGKYSLASDGLLFQKQRKGKDGAMLFQTYFGYRLNNHFSIAYQATGNLDKDFYYRQYFFGGRFHLPLKTTGDQILFNIDGGWSWQNMGISLGEEHSEESFTFGGKKIKADKVHAYTGLRQSGVKTGAGLTYQLSSRFHLEIGASYLFPVVEKDIVILEEKSGFFLFRKKAYEELSNEDIDYRIDDISGNDSGMRFDGWTFQAGLKMMF